MLLHGCMNVDKTGRCSRYPAAQSDNWVLLHGCMNVDKTERCSTYLAVFLIKVALTPVISRAIAVRAGVEDELDIGSGSHERLQSNHYTEQTIL